MVTLWGSAHLLACCRQLLVHSRVETYRGLKKTRKWGPAFPGCLPRGLRISQLEFREVAGRGGVAVVGQPGVGPQAALIGSRRPVRRHLVPRGPAGVLDAGLCPSTFRGFVL